MSKIDELIEHTCGNYKEHEVIGILEQLKPYIELAELLSGRRFKNNDVAIYPQDIAAISEYKAIINKIKEQK